MFKIHNSGCVHLAVACSILNLYPDHTPLFPLLHNIVCWRISIGCVCIHVYARTLYCCAILLFLLCYRPKDQVTLTASATHRTQIDTYRLQHKLVMSRDAIQKRKK